MANQTTNSDVPRRWALSALFLITLVGLYLRIRAAHTDFWLDEAWSWQLTKGVGNPLQILTSIHHDNNHYLNTLWMYLLGDQQDWFLYRIPSIVTGTAAIVVAAMIGWRRSWFHCWAVSLMVALSLLLVICSSEARGSMSAAFFAFAYYDQLDRYFSNGKFRNLLLSIAFAVLGCLSHLTFLLAYVGIFLWSLARSFGGRKSIPQFLKQMLCLHAPFGCFALALYLIDLRFLRIGGGTPFDGLQGLSAASTLMLGGQLLPGETVCFFLLTVALILVGLTRLAIQRSPDFILYAGVLILGPLLFLSFAHSTFFYPRYFLSCVPFALMLMVDLFSVLNKHRAGKIFVIAILAVFSIHNFCRSYIFAIDGRGHYREALSYMLSQGQTNVTAGSDYQFQLKKLLRFYARYLPPDSNITLIPESEWSTNPPEFFVKVLSEVRTPDGDFIDANKIFRMKESIAIAGHQYKLERTYPYSGDMSGSHWLVYKLQ